MKVLDIMKDHGMWIATILAAIIAGVFSLLKKSGSRNSQKIKNIKNSNIQQANGPVNLTINKLEKEKE